MTQKGSLMPWMRSSRWKGPNDRMSGRYLSKGTIALQAHDPGSTVFYKDIQLKITD